MTSVAILLEGSRKPANKFKDKKSKMKENKLLSLCWLYISKANNGNDFFI